ncbi:MAG: radical SAM protein [Terracidiphilus sp.]
MATANHPPGLLMIHLLGRCNLECLHCYMEGSPRRTEQLPLELVLQAIEECPRLGIGTIVVTGGEPLLYRGLDQVLEAAANLPNVQTTLCTNGTLLTAGKAEQFRKLGLRINISIDGQPEFHDRFRNLPGAFRSSERGARHAVDAGIPLTIIGSISQKNLDSLDFLVHWAANVGAGEFFAQPLLNLGRGTQITDSCLSFAQLNRLILKLTDLANRPEIRNLKCQVIGAKKKFLLQHPCGAFVCNGTGCHRGVTKEIKKLVIREDGTVLPEVPTLSHRYALGNIRDGSLSELTERYFARGYDDFDRLCRAAYAEVLPQWDCIVVPWEQILSERSLTWRPEAAVALPAPQCATCEPAYGDWKGPNSKPAGSLLNLCQIGECNGHTPLLGTQAVPAQL